MTSSTRARVVRSLLCLGGVVLLLGPGCGSYVPARSSLPPAATPATQPERAETTVAEPVRLCDALQDGGRQPIECSVDRFGSVLAMIVAFPSESHAKTYRETVYAYVAGPFCSAATHAHQEARVYVGGSQHALGYIDCELARWVNIKTNRRSKSKKATAEDTLKLLNRACKSLQRRQDIFVRCNTRYTNGMARLSLVFRDEQSDLIKPLTEQMVRPFCAAARSDGVVEFAYVASNRGHALSCHTREWGPWYAVNH